MDWEIRKKYLLKKEPIAVGRVRVDAGDGEKPEYQTKYMTIVEMAEKMASKGLDFEPEYEIRVAEIYENPEECREVIRILEDEDFPLKKEWRLAWKELEELKKKVA